MTGTRPLPRDDLRALEGYHSPQVDVEVRLNTNESPYAPPAAFVERWLDALRTVEWNRYPDRAATDLRTSLGAFLGQSPSRLLCGNGSNEILQTLLLTYGGAGRRALMFEPTYALHAQIARGTGTGVVAGERRTDSHSDELLGQARRDAADLRRQRLGDGDLPRAGAPAPAGDPLDVRGVHG